MGLQWQSRCCRFEPSWAKVISGIEEGLYGWIALNYLTGHLIPNAGRDQDSEHSSPHGKVNTPLGSLVAVMSLYKLCSILVFCLFLMYPSKSNKT